MANDKVAVSDLLKDENTEAAGFVWEIGEVQYDPHKNRQKVSLGDAPHVKVIDVSKFEEQFPGVILAALNGTSIKVACQAVTRRALLRDRKAAWTDMQTGVLNSLRGIKSRVAVTVRTEVKYVVGGEVFDTLEDAQEHGRNILASKGLDDEMIENILGDLVKEVPAK